jgi:uncharacterized repeat protein (TIGR01451 family)
MDLYLEKTGSTEGAFPGIQPDEVLTYTVSFGNQGIEKACAPYIEDTLPEYLEPLDPFHNFDILRLIDENGQPIQPINSNGEAINDLIEVTFQDLGDRTYRWDFGDEDQCLPPGSQGEFQLYTRIREDTPNETNLTNTATIGENEAGIDDVQENNTDTSETIAYRADVLVEKNGVACGEDNDCTTEEDNSETEAYLNDLINYTVIYNNQGDIDAEDVLIQETIPIGTCYRIGSVEANQPPASQVVYSSDNGVTWDYVPIDQGDSHDCQVTDFRVDFTFPLPAPATFDGEDAYNELSGDRVDTVRGRYSDKARQDQWEWVRSANDAGTVFVTDTDTDANGNVYATGSFSSTVNFGGITLTPGDGSTGSADIFLAKYDPDGNVVWVKQAGGERQNEARKIKVDNDSNIYLTGQFSGTASFDSISLTVSSGDSYDREIFVAKYDPDGNVVWVKQAGGERQNEARKIKVDNDSNIYLTGQFSGTASFDSISLTVSSGDSYDREIFVAKYDPDGDIEWAKQAEVSSSSSSMSSEGIDKTLMEMCM